jgi:YbgC/YbaW family acyl-CoA thioester hydrolase
MSIPLPLPRISLDEEIMFYDTDCGQVVHNLAYLRLIEKARTMLAREMGLDMKEMATRNQFPVLLRTEVDYRKPAVLSDIVRIEGGLERLERVRFWVNFRITRPSDGIVLVTCRQSLALVEMPQGKVLRLPASWYDQWHNQLKD